MIRAEAEDAVQAVAGLEHLLHDDVLPSSDKEERDAFRREFWAPDVQQSIQPYWMPLKVWLRSVPRPLLLVTYALCGCAQSVFNEWKVIDSEDSDGRNTLNVREFVALLRTKDVLRGGDDDDMRAAVQAFSLAQSPFDASDISQENHSADSQLIFVEFVEALGRYAAARPGADDGVRSLQDLALAVVRGVLGG